MNEIEQLKETNNRLKEICNAYAQNNYRNDIHDLLEQEANKRNDILEDLIGNYLECVALLYVLDENKKMVILDEPDGVYYQDEQICAIAGLWSFSMNDFMTDITEIDGNNESYRLVFEFSPVRESGREIYLLIEHNWEEV